MKSAAKVCTPDKCAYGNFCCPNGCKDEVELDAPSAARNLDAQFGCGCWFSEVGCQRHPALTGTMCCPIHLKPYGENPARRPMPGDALSAAQGQEIILIGELSAATAWIICHTCGRRTLHIHDSGCQVCAPYVPPGTPNSREVTWWADLMDGKQTT